MGADAGIRWGIVGPGAIAGVFADALGGSGAGRVAGVFGRNPERAAAFAGRHGGRVAASMEELLGGVDAVYVATPHPMHAEPVSAALRAGRAVLCEKPMTVSAEETARLVALSRECGVALVEGWMYRAHPQIARAAELISAGAIGDVSRVRAAFGVGAGRDLPERIMSPGLGGGAIYDIGGYPVSAAMLVARAAGRRLVEPRIEAIDGRVCETGVELHATARLDFGDGLLAEVGCSFEEELGLFLEVEGADGTLRLPSVFLPENRRDGRIGELVATVGPQRIEQRPESDCCCFGLETREVGRLVREGGVEARWPMVGHVESVAIARVLDLWKAGVSGYAAAPLDSGS